MRALALAIALLLLCGSARAQEESAYQSGNVAGGGGASWANYSPTWIPSVALWLSASAGVTLNGSTVSSWADQSGKGQTFTQGTPANQPTYAATGGARNSPDLSFDGAHDLLTNGTNVGIGLQNWTLFLVVKFPASSTGGAYQLVWSNQSVAGASGIEIGATSTSNRGILFDGVAVAQDGAMATPWEIWTITNTSVGPLTSFYLNGTAQSLSASASSALVGAAETTIGARATGALFYPGLLEEVIAFSATASASDRARLTQYLGNKYGVPVSL